MVRPSLSSTQSVSSETATSSAKGTSMSMAEVLIPGLPKFITMITRKLLDPSEFYARKSAAALQPNWIEPEFRDPIIPLNMDVCRFVTVSRMEI